ncbi:MAG: hypothetical protein N4A49_09590 [Marinifilaceae bacterium]|nr:hypothetical protein [Marinifilaceae bacterium]
MKNITKAKEILKILEIDLNQTPEKYQISSNEILEYLISHLIELDNLEKEIYNISQKLFNHEEPYQIQDGENEIWDEYRQRHNKITTSVYLKLNDEQVNSFGEPSKYNYLNYPDTKIV